jgi:hypothetical protein
VERELGKRVGAPYFMVTFTLPAELRKLFFTPQAKEIYQLFFAAASSALSDTLANPKIPRSLRLPHRHRRLAHPLYHRRQVPAARHHR